MHVFSPFELVEATAIAAGEIVIMHHKGLFIAALKVQRPENKSFAYLMLEPTAPEWTGRAGLLEAKDFEPASVLKVSGARAIVPGKLDVVSNQRVTPGALVLGNDGRLLVAGVTQGGAIRRYALDDGDEILSQIRDVPFCFPSWEIAAPDARGRMQTLCMVRAAAPSSSP